MRIAMTTHSKASGFSLVELLIVVVIILAIAGLAVPNFMQIYYNMRLKASASELSGLIQQARIEAARRNSICAMLYGNGSPSQAYIDVNLNGQFDNGEPTIVFPTNVLLTSGAPSGSGGQPTPYVLAGDSSNSSFTNGTALGFSARGLPCAYSSNPITCVTPASSYFVYYLNDQRAGSGSAGWAAVIVTRSGRSKVSLWNGSTWQ
jgi:prepilin-type N-terminal cleavage/methylation domain-containing protein